MSIVVEVEKPSDFPTKLNFLVFTFSVAILSWMFIGVWVGRRLQYFFFLGGLDEFELRDRLSVVLLWILVAALTFFLQDFRINKVFSSIMALTVSVMMICSFGWVTNYRGEYNPSYWSGFGLPIAFWVAVLIVVLQNQRILKKIEIWQSSDRLISTLNLCCWALIGICYIPSAIQIPNGMIGESSRWALNEFIAPLTGHIPLSNFTAQYSNYLGLPLLIIKPFVSETLFPFATLMWINALVLVEFVLFGWIVRSIFPKLKYGICLLIPLATILVKSSIDENQYSSIAEGMTAIPGRSLLPVVSLVLLIKWAVQRSHRNRILLAALVGISSAASALNNFEFGAASVAVIILVLTMGYFSSAPIFRTSEILVFFVGLIFAVLFAWFCYLISGNSFEISRLIAYSRVFGKQGFANLAMPTFGLYLFIFVTMSVAAVLGLRHMVRRGGLPKESKDVAAQLVGVYFGCWGVISLLYYAGRSVNSGQLQYFLLPTVFCIVAIWRLSLIGAKLPDSRISILYLRSPILLLWMIFPFVTVLQAPNPSIEFNRLMNSEVQWSIEAVTKSEIGLAVESFLELNEDTQVGYFGVNPNLTQLAFNVVSVAGVNDPGDMFASLTIYALACKDMVKFGAELVIVQKKNFPEAVVLQFCNSDGLVYEEALSNEFFYVYRTS